MFNKIGPMELILILGVALLIFGPSKLPELGKAMGKSIRSFKGAMSGVTDEVGEAVKDVKQTVTDAKSSVTDAVTK